MPFAVQNHDTVVYPTDRETGRTFRVTIRTDRIVMSHPDWAPGVHVAFRRTFSRGRWVYTDLRDGARVDETDVVREMARVAFRGDRDRAAAALRAAR